MDLLAKVVGVSVLLAEVAQFAFAPAWADDAASIPDRTSSAARLAVGGRRTSRAGAVSSWSPLSGPVHQVP